MIVINVGGCLREEVGRLFPHWCYSRIFSWKLPLMKRLLIACIRTLSASYLLCLLRSWLTLKPCWNSVSCRRCKHSSLHGHQVISSSECDYFIECLDCGHTFICYQYMCFFVAAQIWLVGSSSSCCLVAYCHVLQHSFFRLFSVIWEFTVALEHANSGWLWGNMLVCPVSIMSVYLMLHGLTADMWPCVQPWSVDTTKVSLRSNCALWMNCEYVSVNLTFVRRWY